MQEELEHGGAAYQKRKKVKKTKAVQMKWLVLYEMVKHFSSSIKSVYKRVV